MKTEFTYEEVKHILCKHCRQKSLIPSTDMLLNGRWIHHINGDDVKCKANRWRNKAAHLEATCNENPSNPTSPV